MTPLMIGLLSIVAILVLVQSGLHIGIALAAVSFFGVALIRDNFDIAGTFLALAALDSIAKFSFGVIPLFVLMGLLVSISGIGRDIFDVAGQLFRRVTGGLGVATVFANAIFAAVNGTSIASASVFTRIAVPELLRHGYSAKFSVGVVAGSSVLGMLIPPSLLLILYGIIAEVSIGSLFTAGILPGITLAILFIATIFVIGFINPADLGNSGERTAKSDVALMSAGQMLWLSFPIVLLIVIVLGGIYGGVFTPTEAGAMGAFASLLVAIARRKLTLRGFWDLLLETGTVTAAISFVIIAAHIYARLLSLSGLPSELSAIISTRDLGFVTVMIAYLVLVILLGTILDSASIMLILLPLVVPVMINMEVDLVWFGIVTIVAVEIGLLTPPLGLACFVIKSNLQDHDIPISTIFRGALPFVAAMFVALLIVIFVPELSLALIN
ncbi:TRAP transporter large permease [Martelella soudanensis]|uniref:TRAP transporter large permease n=1 Tax=unclassified Martelella TaxID=2629616 RepID=UPI0015DE0F14|nr:MULTISPECIES: TRAP transporter large permease [unclassified Martelella]